MITYPFEQSETRARALLIAHLDPTQCADLEANRSFSVIGRSGSRYRIQLTSECAVVLDQLQPSYGWCIAPRAMLPQSDWALAFKLLIEADERAFLLTGVFQGPPSYLLERLERLQPPH